jgi:(p)ppGpp synthase/HD superfamily hydrolase
MHAYAQTNVELFNQLRREGYSNADLSFVRDAYELAMTLYTGRFLASGKVFIAHLVRTASILASLRLRAQVVVAGLLHNVYLSGDFGNARTGLSSAKRDEVRKVLGAEAEEYVARFAPLSLDRKSITIDIARDNPDRLGVFERNLLLILLAEHMEHLLDLDILYYRDAERDYYINNAGIAIEIAQKLGCTRLAEELDEALRETKLGELPVSLAERKPSSLIIVPRSCRRRAAVAVQQIVNFDRHRLRAELIKGLKLLCRSWLGRPVQKPEDAAGAK